MARTRKIDNIDEMILGIMSGDLTHNDAKYFSASGADIECIAADLNQHEGAEPHNKRSYVHQPPTVRYHIRKLQDMGYLRQRGVCGWGRSYTYHYITDEERKQNALQLAQAKFRDSFADDLTDMLTAVGVETTDGYGIDRYGMIEVKATDIARLLRENYSFETVYEDENESQSA